MCPVGVDSEQASRILDVGMSSHHVEFSLPATLVVMASAVSTSASQPHSLFTAFEQTSLFPCALGHSLVYAGLPSLTLQVAKGRA